MANFVTALMRSRFMMNAALVKSEFVELFYEPFHTSFLRGSTKLLDGDDRLLIVQGDGI